jgi:hypothetical protein
VSSATCSSMRASTSASASARRLPPPTSTRPRRAAASKAGPAECREFATAHVRWHAPGAGFYAKAGSAGAPSTRRRFRGSESRIGAPYPDQPTARHPGRPEATRPTRTSHVHLPAHVPAPSPSQRRPRPHSHLPSPARHEPERTTEKSSQSSQVLPPHETRPPRPIRQIKSSPTPQAQSVPASSVPPGPVSLSPSSEHRYAFTFPFPQKPIAQPHAQQDRTILARRWVLGGQGVRGDVITHRFSRRPC